MAVALVEKKYIFVDKTLLIKDIVEDSPKVIILPRPRRFGKTTNLSMLECFLSNDKRFDRSVDLFKGLKVSLDSEFCAENQNKYPVIFVSFKNIKELSYKNTLDAFKVFIGNLYDRYWYLTESGLMTREEVLTFTRIVQKKSSLAELKNSLGALTKYLSEFNKKKVMVLIDEYDTPIVAGYVNDYYKEVIDLLRGLLGGALKDNVFLEKAVVTGIARVSQESIFSGVNNVDVYSLLSSNIYSQYFGFLESEVEGLVGESEVDLAEIKKWYNGYQTGGGDKVFNPWSVINCLKRGKIDVYWANTSDNVLIETLLAQDVVGIKRKLGLLLQGETIEEKFSENLVLPKLVGNNEAIWSLLVYSGYLSVVRVGVRGRRHVAVLEIPNEEVRFIYDDLIEQWFNRGGSLDDYDGLIKSLVDGDVEGFKVILSLYIGQSGSYFDFSKNSAENVYHVFVLGLVVGLRDDYYIRSNQESGLGRFDIAIIPKGGDKRGIIMEFKVVRDGEMEEVAGEVLQQIRDRDYVSVFSQHGVSEVLGLGICFCGKRVEVKFEYLSA